MKTIKILSSVVLVAALSLFAANRANATTTPSVVYTDTFESYTNGTPLIDGTNYWYASDTNCIVQTNDAAPGSVQSALIPIDTTLSNRFAASTSSNIYIHLEAKMVRYDGTNNPYVNTNNSTVIFYVDSNGYFVAYDGISSNWITITTDLNGQPAPVIDENTWVTNLDVYIDYTLKTWQLSMGTNTLTNNIGFANPSISSLSGFEIYNGGSRTTYVDNVYVYEPMSLRLNPTALSQTIIAGQSAVAQTFDVVAVGNGSVDYTIVTNFLDAPGNWAQLDQGIGTVSNYGTNVLTIVYHSTNLTISTYYGQFGVGFSNWVGLQSRDLDFLLDVTTLTVAPTNFISAVMKGYAPTGTNFTLTTSGTNTPTFVITTNPAAQWVSVVPGSGTLISGTTTVSVNYVTNGLAEGTQSTMLDIVTSMGGGSTDKVGVAVTTLSRPIANLSTNALAQTIQKGVQPANTNITLSNIGVAPRSGMKYSVTSDQAWLLAATNSFSTNNEARVINVNFADMTTNSGSYTGTLTIATVDTNIDISYTPVGMITSVQYVSVQVTIVAPPTPTGLSASDGTETDSIKLMWTAVTTNLNHYEIWRANSNYVNSATRIVSNQISTTYFDTSVNEGLDRWYWIRTINDAGGASEFSVPDKGWRFLPAPTGITASQGTYTNRVALSWTASAGAVTYEIRRYTLDIYASATLIGTVTSSITAFDDTTGTAIQPYFYWITAATPDMGNHGGSVTGYRAAYMKPTGLAASKGTFSDKVRLSWTASAGASNYEIWRSADSIVGNATKIGDSSITAYDDTSASAGQPYYYWIKAGLGQIVSEFSDPDNGWRMLAVPSGVSATQGTRPYSVRISWSAVAYATGYEVVRAMGPGLDDKAQALTDSVLPVESAPSLVEGIVMLSETTNAFFDDNATFAGVSYSYSVRAKNAFGNSDYSGAVSGSRQTRHATTTKRVENDFDGDKIADVILFNANAGVWRILCTSLGEFPVYFGDSTCVPVRGDYDGDMLADPMIYSAANGYWRIMMSSAGYAPIRASFGGAGKLAAPADYDNDKKMDLAVFDTATGVMTALFSGSNYAPTIWNFGTSDWSTSVPVSVDFDGDGKADPAIYSDVESILRVKLSSAGYAGIPIAIAKYGAMLVPGDFDGDGLSELTTYNETTGILTVQLSSAGYFPVNVPLGGPGFSYVVPSDYDGDGLLDPAVYSEGNGWRIMFSGSGYLTVSDSFGGVNNIPYVP